MNENNSTELSTNNPLTETAGLEAVLGMINPKDGQVDDESVTETETEEVTNELSEEEVETPVETEEVELEVADDVINDIELEDSEYEYLLSAKEFLNENGLDDIDKIKNGILMQGDYTRKTQALAEEKKAFESERTQSLEKAAEVLEIAQAMVYGQQPKHTTQELLALKQSDPIAYEQALEAKILYEQKQAEIKDLTDKVGTQYQEQQQATIQAKLAEQSEILIGLEPGFADEKVATEKVEVMSEYLKGIGGDPAILNNVTDAIVIKVLHDAAMADKTQKQVSATKAPKKKTASKTVIRKGTSTSKAEKQVAAQKAKMKQAIQKDGSYSKESAVELILDSFR
tara:strand:+ start:5318 stop:6343 length:1026 start_codon:yes stop_codon:yes gene_type:complete